MSSLPSDIKQTARELAGGAKAEHLLPLRFGSLRIDVLTNSPRLKELLCLTLRTSASARR